MTNDEVHVVWHTQAVSRTEREKLNGHRGCVLWFTGLSGCGKSTVANVVDHKLHQLGVHTFLLERIAFHGTPTFKSRPRASRRLNCTCLRSASTSSLGCDTRFGVLVVVTSKINGRNH